ncbi:hypothetical protein GCM10023187_40620 [Nibrella viscosa]|uniref:Cytochrome c domain-containing protein n=1 Tax=Nibrella viscosa TaxID=1084524 RepID=A0ABP8KPZ2_9BACT
MRVLLIVGLGVLSLTAFGQPKKPTVQTTSVKTAPTVQVGLKVYEQYCLTCHQANGSGVPGLNPPLQQTDWVLGNKTRLINVVLKGLRDAEVNGEYYSNEMPAHDFLSDQQIADVLTFIRSHFGNKAEAVLADEVKAARNAH